MNEWRDAVESDVASRMIPRELREAVREFEEKIFKNISVI